MATIQREFQVQAPAKKVWAAIQDFANPQALAKGFVTEAKLEGNARIVTFANGYIARELLVTNDNAQRRLVYSSIGGRASHHNASFQVFEDGENQSRVVWITDLLPDEMATPIEAMVDQGVTAIQRTLGLKSS